MARGQEEELRIDLVRVDYWLSTGAQPTDRVSQLVARWRKMQSEQALGDASGDDEPSADLELAADPESTADAERAADPESTADAEPTADADSSTEPA